MWKVDMRNILSSLLCLGLVATSAGSGKAADNTGLFAIRGNGVVMCGDLVNAINEADDPGRAEIVRDFASWLGGYLTFANRTVGERFDVTPLVADIDMLAVVVDRCEKEPSLLFETASFEIFSVLLPFGTSSFSEVSALDSGLPVREETVSMLRQVLVENGYILDDAANTLQNALEQFNADQGIASGNALSIETVLKLLEMASVSE